jgi:hypothetical protein
MANSIHENEYYFGFTNNLYFFTQVSLSFSILGRSIIRTSLNKSLVVNISLGFW